MRYIIQINLCTIYMLFSFYILCSSQVFIDYKKKCRGTREPPKQIDMKSILS